MKTSQQVREEFEHNGDSISRWAIDNGFAPSLVYRVLSSAVLPKRGQSHDIAVMLGMKKGSTSEIRAQTRVKEVSSSLLKEGNQ